VAGTTATKTTTRITTTVQARSSPVTPWITTALTSDNALSCNCVLCDFGWRAGVRSHTLLDMFGLSVVGLDYL
jgi:hypothetical protein